MKNIARLFAVMALLMIGVNNSRLLAAVLVDNIYYEIDSTGTSAYVRQSVNTIETANILDVVNIDGKDYPVTSIGSGAFSSRKNLTSVNIGQNITTIGESAFLYCSLLPSVSLPAGLKSIGNSAFAYCTSLSSVSLPAGLKSVGNYAFSYCTSLSSVVIPDGVTSLGEHVFVDCSKLETVVLPSSLTSLGYSAFTNCSSLKSIDIPGSLATISTIAFEGCSSLVSVTFNEGLQAIETGAFRNCVALESITFPESFAFIETEVFSGCTSLLSVTMKGSTPPVPPSEYWGTFSGETVKSGVLTVPAGSKEAYKASRVWGVFVNIIEEGVAVEIVDGLRFVKDAIYYEVVSAADKTVEVTFGGETPTEIMGEYTGNVVVPQTVNYENIDFKVIGVCDGAFYRCYSLVSVTLPEGMKYIGESAFGQCYELASVTLPEGLETIGYAAFSECSLTSVTLPASLTSMDAFAFSQCANVSSIKVKEGNTVYDSRNNCNAVIETKSNKLIWGCYNTIVPKGVTSIGDWAFRYCSNLTSITLPAGVTSIGREAFYYCKKMTSIVIPESVTSLGNNAFMGCESLKSIVLPPNISYIDTETFFGCASLATVVLPSNLMSIGYQAFKNCSSLASITIPASVQSVDSYAFYDCLSLDSLFMERQTPPVAYDYTFNTFTNTVLTVPVGAKSAYKSANVWKNFVTILEEGENEIRDGDKFEKNGMFYTIISVEDKTVEVTFKGETYSEVNNEYSGEVIVPQTVNFEDIDFKVVGIGLSAFDQCSAVTSVVLPNSITNIGAGAFNGTSISSITLPASVTTVGGYAFFDCRSLASIILEGSTPPTAYDASFNTYETTVLIVPAGAKSAYQSANVWKKFATIREEGEGEIKDGDKFEKDGMFYTILSVEDKTVEVTFKGETYYEVNDDYSGDVVIPQTVNYEDIDFKVVSIGNTAFAACENLKSVTISGNVKTIGNSAFARCTKLSAVNIPEGVTSIGVEAFYNCSGLTSISIPNSVTSIGGATFSGCSGLTSVTIPNSVTSIGIYAFSGCSISVFRSL